MSSLGKRKQDVCGDALVPKKPRADDDQVKLLSLQHLLDFTSLSSTSQILDRFDTLARALLHDFHLIVRCQGTDTRYEILELEFYLQMEGCHEDPFTHESEEQKLCGRWYFHRAPRRTLDSRHSATSLTGYRGGTRKGLDLTAGRPASVLPTTKSPYFPPATPLVHDDTSGTPTASSNPRELTLRGGILLRSIRRASDSKVISGPSLLVDQILLASNASSISELVEEKWAGDMSAFAETDTDHDPEAQFNLYLHPRPATGTGKPTIYSSPRIGLDLSHPGTTPSTVHPRVAFLPCPYRYFVFPHLLTANGRPQTFLGVLRACIDSGTTIGSQKLQMELVKITGLKDGSVRKYLDDYNGGIQGGSLHAFVGSAGKGVSSSPAAYLRMMGVLERLKNTLT